MGQAETRDPLWKTYCRISARFIPFPVAVCVALFVLLPSTLILQYGWGGCLACMTMSRTLAPLLQTFLFTILAPGSVLVWIPYRLLGTIPALGWGPVSCFGLLLVFLGAGIYFRCAWEFAVRGLGTPAPIAPTKFLVVTALHRHVRNPMYIGVLTVVLGEAMLFHARVLLAYAACACVLIQLFVVFYEEPTLHRQFGESYDEYRRTVPRWIPRFRK
jgi:protein-S-isoprenylcysteine O-methyltransferase Ste14